MRSVVLAASIAAVGAFVAPGTAAHAVPQTVRPIDFNGDGHSDLAVGAPRGAVSGLKSAGYVSVVYGASGGVNPAKHAVISQNSAGVPGGAETGDTFGTKVEPVDFNHDGYTDLLVGAPGEDIGAGAAGVDEGMITVLWGSQKGLAAGTVAATAVDITADAGTHVGGIFTSGDYDGDGAPDIEFNNRGMTLTTLLGVGADGKVSRIAQLQIWDTEDEAQIVYDLTSGDMNGDGVSDLVMTSTDFDEEDTLRSVIFLGSHDGLVRKGIALAPKLWLSGMTAVIGDINGDGYGDLVVGHNYDWHQSDAFQPVKGGAVGVAYGGPDGQSTTIPPVWINQDTPGVPGVSESGDQMGADVSVGDVNGDGYADVVAGVPDEDYSGLTDPGSFLLLLGSANGLTGNGSQVFTQNSAGLPGVSEAKDAFGATVAVIPATDTERAQVAAGDPAENAGNGAVWVLHGTATGLTGTNTANYGSATMGAPATGADFGYSLSKRR
jgi:hypothetical protein